MTGPVPRFQAQRQSRVPYLNMETWGSAEALASRVRPGETPFRGRLWSLPGSGICRPSDSVQGEKKTAFSFGSEAPADAGTMSPRATCPRCSAARSPKSQARLTLQEPVNATHRQKLANARYPLEVPQLRKGVRLRYERHIISGSRSGQRDHNNLRRARARGHIR